MACPDKTQRLSLTDEKFCLKEDSGKMDQKDRK